MGWFGGFFHIFKGDRELGGCVLEMICSVCVRQETKPPFAIHIVFATHSKCNKSVVILAQGILVQDLCRRDLTTYRFRSLTLASMSTAECPGADCTMPLHGFLNPNDAVAISFWIISISMVAATVFFSK